MAPAHRGRRTLLQVLACFPAPASRTYLRAALNLSADALGVAIAELLQGSLIQLQGTVARRTYVLPPLRTFALSVCIRSPTWRQPSASGSPTPTEDWSASPGPIRRGV